MPMSIAAILLAAGASRRLGRPKQLLILGGETLIERAIRVAKEAGASPILVVLGANENAISAATSIDRAIVVSNPEWEAGLATSIHAGIRALEADCVKERGVILMGCDQPRLSSTHLRELIDVFTKAMTPTIVASAYAGINGVPALFPPLTFAALRALRGDKGARSILANPPCKLIALPFEGGEVDVDFPDDVAKMG